MTGREDKRQSHKGPRKDGPQVEQPKNNHETRLTDATRNLQANGQGLQEPKRPRQG